MSSNIYPEKIIFITGSLGNGGAERQLYYSIKLLKEKKIEILILSLSDNKYYLKKINNLGVDVKIFNWNNNPLSKLCFIILHCIRYNPKILQSVHSYVNIYTMLASKILRKIFYASVRDEFNSWSKNKFLNYFSLKYADRIICNSYLSINQLKHQGFLKPKLFYLANYIDTSLYKPNIKQKSETLRILYLGGLRKVKRIDKFLFICSYLKTKNINFKAKIVGSGVLEEELKNIAQSLSLSNNDLKFFPETDSVLKYYNWSNILIQTSSSEGMSNVIIESMACGLLVFSTNVGDAPHLIENGKNGFIFNSDHSESMSGEFLRIIQDKSIDFSKIRNDAVKTIKEKHTFKRFNLNISKLYENY